MTDILAVEIGSKYKYQNWLNGIQNITTMNENHPNLNEMATQTSELEALSVRISYDISQQNYPKFNDSNKKIYESLELD